MSKNQPKIPDLIKELVTTLHANGFRGIIGRWELNSEGDLETKVEIQTTTKQIDAAFVMFEKEEKQASASIAKQSSPASSPAVAA